MIITTVKYWIFIRIVSLIQVVLCTVYEAIRVCDLFEAQVSQIHNNPSVTSHDNIKQVYETHVNNGAYWLHKQSIAHLWNFYVTYSPKFLMAKIFEFLWFVKFALNNSAIFMMFSWMASKLVCASYIQSWQIIWYLFIEALV